MNNLIYKTNILWNHIKDGEFDSIFKEVKKRISSNKDAFGLKRELKIPFKNPDAKIELAIRLFESRDSKYFDMTRSADGLINQNIPTCYVATSKDDVPRYRQWLMSSCHNKKIQSYFKGTFPVLKDDEALLEGAFTPPMNRGMRIMPAAMARIAEKATDVGAKYVITFVTTNNIPSLKGCKRSGFHPYILRKEKWFLFNRTITFTDVPQSLMDQYLIDVADRPKTVS